MVTFLQSSVLNVLIQQGERDHRFVTCDGVLNSSLLSVYRVNATGVYWIGTGENLYTSDVARATLTRSGEKTVCTFDFDISQLSSIHGQSYALLISLFSGDTASYAQNSIVVVYTHRDFIIGA